MPNVPSIPEASNIAQYVNRKIKENTAVWGQITGNLTDQSDLVSYIDQQAEQPLDYVIYAQSLADLPAPVGNVITIQTGTTLVVSAPSLDLQGNRLFFEEDAALQGWSSETSLLFSTLGNGEALITGAGSLPIVDLALALAHNGIGAAPVFFDLDGIAEPGAAIDWRNVNIVSNFSAGTIKNYANAIFVLCAFIDTIGGLTFAGTFDSIVFESSIFRDTISGSTLLNFDASLTINRRIRIENTPIVVPVGSIGINLPVSATIPIEGYIAKFVNFSGAGTYLQGVQPADNKSFFFECRGVANSATTAQYYFEDNLTTTTVTAINTYYKVQGTTILKPETQRFTMPLGNRAFYSGAITNTFIVNVSASFTSGNSNQIAFKIYKNGSPISGPRALATANASGRAENVKTEDIIELAQNDYIEVFVANLSATSNVLVTDLNLIITKS